MVTAFFIEDHIIKAYTIPLWVDVKLANRVGLVASIAKDLWHRGQCRVHLKMFVENSIAVGLSGGASQDGPPRRYARGCR
jgi:hypothetical protein